MLTPPRVKICGLTRADEARLAVEAGVDAVGLVFHPRSPRHVTLEQACAVVASVPAFVTVVGLFMNPDREQVEQTLARVPLDILQFHGRETGAFCRAFGRRYIKALGMSDEPDMVQAMKDYADAAALLVDSHAGDRDGGSGEAFDWARWPSLADKHLILAGGLTPDNVGEAVSRLKPWAVDVSSGVEAAPGRKDPEKMTRFIREVHRACKSH
jgi:phosphoribosylanthranilate isomerase